MNLPPEEMSVNMLINEISRISRNEAREVGDSIKLMPSARSILFFLCHEDGLNQLDLSKLTHLKPPTISVTLAKLEEEGYVERRQYENDRRQTRVFVTNKGRAFDNRVREVYDYQDKVISERLSGDESSELKRLLIKVMEAVMESTAKSDN